MIEERTPQSYDFRSTERTWQERWERDGLYRVADDAPEPRYYVLEMLPYPSGDLHVGHAKNYTLGDALARMMRMQGYSVIHPMGFDAFGLPAENAAIQRGVAPEAWTRSNIANMERQIRLMGTGYDWTREFATCDPEYYRWNQWLFARMFEDGLAYKKEAPVNWCPVDQTVLANEQAEGGVCWRCGNPVERRNLAQWFLKITAFADRLLADMDQLEGWPERIKVMQRNWIGRSEGVTFAFAVENVDAKIPVFTTRIDTVFGVTYMAVAPEHPIVERLLDAAPKRRHAVETFRESLKSKSDLERTSLMEKAGVFTGTFAINPLSHERVPIWVTNYVLAEYGTGAVMGVPAHDERDFDFARKHGIPIAQVIVPPSGQVDGPLREAYVEDGKLIASGDYTGMTSERARKALALRLEALGAGETTVNYRLRDWLISRQRYWGTPIPIVYCPEHGEVAVPDDQLPVLLPPDAPITGQGSPLARDEAFMTTACPKCGGPARRESDTMDTFFDSSWYYMRYVDPHNASAPFDPAKVAGWTPVDQYIGGSEHAVLHLLYARMFYKWMHDRGWIAGRNEPFTRLFNQGMVLANSEKMSKSRGNVVGIDETVEKHGVDAMRLFLLAAAPAEDTLEWTDEGISGRVRFLARVWRACEPLAAAAGAIPLDRLPPIDGEAQRALVRAVHVAAQSGLEETQTKRFHFNTTTARLDELVNALTGATRDAALANDPAVLYAVHALPVILAPFAPHISEELWHRMGHAESVHRQRWLVPDAEALRVEAITLVVQINGKIRARIEAKPGLGEDDAVALALADANVQHHLSGNPVRKRIYVQDKLLNLVVSG